MKALTPPRLLAAVAAACVVLPSCQRNTEAKADSEWWRLEAERVEVAHQVELFELRLSKQKAGDQGFAGLQAEVERGKTWRHELALQRDGLREEIERSKEAVEVAKLEWMRSTRAAVTGREFAKLTGARGRTYENAVVTRVTDAGVEFRHATGTARLDAKNLTPAQHEIFGLDAQIAGDAIREEQETALAYDSWIDERVAAAEAVQQQEEEERAALAMASRPAPRATPSLAGTPGESSSRSRLDEPPRSVGRSSGTTVWYSNYYYRPRYRSYSYTGTRSRSSVLYDPCTGGAPARVNATPSRAPSKGWTFRPRSSGGNTPVTSGYRSSSSVITP